MSRFCLSITAASIVALSQVTFAAPPDSSRANVGVQSILEVEADRGDSRLKPLQGILRKHPASASARWQAGQVRHGDQWTDFRVIPSRLAGNEAIRRYRKIRADYPVTAAGQLKLADWCRANQLAEREQAHLTVALQLSKNPNNTVLRGRLGFRRVNGVWMKPEAIHALKRSQHELVRNLAYWRPKIRILAKQLGSRRPELRKRAEKELRSIQDPAALPALEAVLSRGGLKQSQLLVEILAAMRTHKSADSLARLAVLSSFDDVRKQASKRLRSRSIESFAPELLATMRTPIDSKLGLFIGAGGVHLVHHATSETQNVRQLFSGRLSTVIRTNGGFGSRPTGARNSVRRTTENAAIDAALRARAAGKNMARRNTAVKAWNDRVCAVLADATGVRLPAEPDQWWDWWRDYNQMTEEPKRYETYTYYRRRTEIVNSGERSKECLVAGTLIWTDRGPVPVQDVRIGDLALAKHPDTGKLSYRPVLFTTVRKPEPIYKVTTAAGTIRGTGGHTFWVSGKGWTKLRNVKPGQRFHTATGSTEIVKLEKDAEAKTYNLLVADVHTYFVGKMHVLSHDLTFAAPTDAVVPGLKPRIASAHR